MAQLNHHSILKNRSEIDTSKGVINRTSMNSFQVSPRSSREISGAHDYTDIMGYKNIDISRDVDQSYMLKGSSTNRLSSQNQTLILDKQSSLGSNNNNEKGAKINKSMGYYAGSVNGFKTGRISSQASVEQSGNNSVELYL